jgi:hypothetical protein
VWISIRDHPGQGAHCSCPEAISASHANRQKKSVLMKQLRYKAVEQKTLSFAGLDFRFAGNSPRRSGWQYGAMALW